MDMGGDATSRDMNADCVCLTLDRAALEQAFERETGKVLQERPLSELRPTLVSNQTVFIAPEHMETMARLIVTIDAVAKCEGYRKAVLEAAPQIARFEPGPIGIFMSYDFHLGPGGPKLIEINTNAGGGLVNALVARAQKACCDAIDRIFPESSVTGEIEEVFLAGFRSEWRRQKLDRDLSTIAIVDAEPQAQYLYPEFVLFRSLFERHGITAVITAPELLDYRDGRLWSGTVPIDLVYNRLTDFAFDEPASAALRSAYLAGDVVVTPNPWAHAVFADKRNLVRLTDAPTLRDWGVDVERSALLREGIAATEFVSLEKADDLWARRDKLFFKPVAGFGGRATYRGDKVTRRVWQSILEGDYIAQELVPPSNRTVVVDGRREIMKVDFRNYAYDGAVQLVAARLYQGQTTNFRTPGGGFAPVAWAKPESFGTLHDCLPDGSSCA